MSRLDDIFASLRASRRKALMPFICGGHPAPGALAGLLASLQRGGASVVEIGFPFSDPIADGPIIAAAMNQVLARGGTPDQLFDEIALARPTTSLGLVAMLSVSIIWRTGLPAILDRASRAGIDGFIVPDLPVEESAPILCPMRDAGFSTSLLIAPSTPPQRAERIARASSGFIYLLARAGITGESGPAPDIADRVRTIRAMTDLPIACGFGISTAAHVRAVVEHADAAIVGSALVRRLADAVEASQDPLSVAETFTTDLAAGLAARG